MEDLSLKELIGFIAGDVYELLSQENKGLTLAQLCKKLKRSEREILLAIGWLYREDNIYIEKTKRGALKVYLNR